MAAKKKAPQAAKATRTKKKPNATTRRVPARKAGSILELRQSVSRAELQVRRAGIAYIEKATELEAARLAQRAAERQLAALAASQALQQKRPFYNFLAQGDSWFSYTCGFAIIHWLRARFRPENAYFDNIAASGRTLRQMLSREFKEELAAGPPNGGTWNGILLSGGGNDICGDHRFRDWLKPNDGGRRPAEYYITSAFDHELAILNGIYEEAIALVGKTAPGVRLFAHE